MCAYRDGILPQVLVPQIMRSYWQFLTLRKILALNRAEWTPYIFEPEENWFWL